MLRSDTVVDSLDCMNADGTDEHLLVFSGETVPDDCGACDFTDATIEVYSGDTT